MKTDISVKSPEALVFLLQSLRFWLVSDIWVTILEYIMMCGMNEREGLSFSSLAEFADILKPLFQIRAAEPESRILLALDLGKSLDMIKWLHENGMCEFSAHHCSRAAYVGDVDTLQYLHQHHCPWDERTILQAIRKEHLDCPKSAEGDCMQVAASTSVAMVRHLRDAGLSWDERTMRAAALCGRLDVLQYLHRAGCPWDASACAGAAEGGQLAFWTKTTTVAGDRKPRISQRWAATSSASNTPTNTAAR